MTIARPLSNCSAILLAAGRSSRMGQFKPLLQFRSSTIIETCLDTIEDAGVETVVVVVGHRGDEVRAAMSERKIIFAVNPDPESEMSSSIAIGIQALDPSTTAVFLALADQPAIPASIYSLLLEERVRSGARIVLPEFEGHRGHPVLIDLSLRNELVQLDRNQGLRGFLDQFAAEVMRVPVDCPYVRFDVDTPDDYRRLTESVRRTAENV